MSRTFRPSRSTAFAAALLLLLAAACSGGGGGEGPGGNGQPPTTASATVTPDAGGVLSLASGPTLEVPPVAVGTATSLTVERASAPAPGGGTLYAFGPPGTTFSQPATVRLPVPAGTTDASVYWTKPGSTTEFDSLGGTIVDGEIVAAVDHFSAGFVGAPCVADAPCDPGLGSCTAGKLACTTGAPVCVAAGVEADGALCNDGGLPGHCAAGTCVATARNVTGTWRTRFWKEDGTQVLVDEAVGASTIWATHASAGRIAGALAADGTFSIPAVPAGPYLLELRFGGGAPTFVDETVSVLDLGTDELGRPDVVYATTTTRVTFELSGLTPWRYGTGTQDALFLAMANAGGSAGPVYGSPASIPAGATTGIRAIDWQTLPQWHMGLVEAAKGDGLWIHQVATHDAAVAGTTVSYHSASTYAHVTDLTLQEGVARAVPVAMTAAPQVPVPIDFRATQFARYDAEVSAAAGTTRFQQLFVGAAMHTLSRPAPFNTTHLPPQVFLLQATPPATLGDVNLGVVSYGRFLPATWKEFRYASRGTSVPFTAPGATTPVVITTAVVRTDPMPAPNPIVPVVSPPRALTLRGVAGTSAPLAATAPRTVDTLTPTLSWTAPSVGAPRVYVVALFRLGVGAGGATTSTNVATFRTAATSVTVPSGVLDDGGAYVAVVTAYTGAIGWDTAPRRRGLNAGWAGAISGVISVDLP